ncbi:MAG: VWA domain-containing protein [Planctomycetota bacterium]|jgi:Ca-activated chloride channel family protein
MGALDPLGGLTLTAPWLLLMALLVPLVLLSRRRRGSPAVLFAPGGFGRSLPRSWRVRLLPLPPGLQVLGLLLAVLALARPVKNVPVPRTTEGIDILLCLDVSSSMAANDMDPRRARLDVAKGAAAAFVAGRPDDRIGLVCFARFPDLRCPPTLDHDALGEIIEAVALVENDGPEDATGIGTALARSAQVLGSGEAESKVVILLTDGEENVATADKREEIAPLHAGQLCEKLGIKVFAIAAGLGGRDSSGRWVPLDTRQVRRLAERTGGRFFTARDAGAVAGVYAEIDALTKVEFAEPRYRVEEWFLPFLAAAVALLLLGRLLESRWLLVLP